MTARVYCTVLLCLAGCWRSTEAALGQNVTGVGYSAGKVIIKGASGGCVSHRDCSGGYKCCGTVCVPPSFIKPGVCPSTKYEAALCALLRFMPCADDSDCVNDQKCCSNGCGRQCMAPVTAMDQAKLVIDSPGKQVNPMPSLPRPGVCPSIKYIAGMCPWIRFVSCANDSDCANNQKCCNNGCGLQCMAPVTAMDQAKLDIDSPGKQVNQMPSLPRPGVCPSIKYIPGMCPWIRFVSCTNDSDCANNQKCCNNGCGLQCMAPVTVKPGVCPKTNDEEIMCIMKGEELCADDNECPKEEKCCSTICDGRQCTAPVTAMDQIKLVIDPPSKQVNQIPSLPRPGVCPSIKYMPVMCPWIRFVSCANDTDCANNQKCCSNGCGLQCMAPVTVKPGVCPKTNDEEIMCIMKGEELCADDNECPKEEKCCSTVCNGRQCTAPVTVKPGVCPKTNDEEIMCIMKGEELCADDNECPKEEKCCSTVCDGRQCTAPVTAMDQIKLVIDPPSKQVNQIPSLPRPGVCPSIKYMPVMCPWIRFVSCANDSDCANNQKCCSNGCGLQCMAPVTVKPGVCPKTNDEEIMCIMKGEELCADDNECPKEEKCCSTVCNGRQCTAPVTAMDQAKLVIDPPSKQVNQIPSLPRPGVCPSIKYMPVMCPWIRFVSCANDTDCANNQKCCSNGCGLQCMASVTVKPGVCPKTNDEEIMCIMKGEELCADDNECPKEEKCCSTVCNGRQCTAPVTAMDQIKLVIDPPSKQVNQMPSPPRPGVCPCRKYIPGMCPWIRFVPCANDSDCANNQKCCSNGCGLQCMAPVTVKPGVCPKTNDEEIMCIMKGEELCADDNECPKEEKCCSTVCDGRQCTAPVTVNPGVCPSRKYIAAMCAWIRFVSCADDRDCANNQKCCSNGCGLQCMAPVTAMDQAKLDSNTPGKLPVNQMPSLPPPGVCPSRKYIAAVCPWIRFVSCADDSDCANNQKCCSNGCGLQCMAPVTVKPGVCPKTNDEEIMCIMKGEELCADDNECPKEEKCCSTVCDGRQCTAPVTAMDQPKLDIDLPGKQVPSLPLPGVCPSRIYIAAVCAWIRFVSCTNDSDCANNEKCCSNGCGLQCMAPVTVNPGECPATNHEAAMCFMMGLVMCADDSDCANNQKCCSAACGGRQCVAPVTVNPGVCPSTKYEAAVCPWIRFVSCAEDRDCANNQKCCSNGCGLQCMAPVTAKPGVCPSTGYVKVMCIMKGEELCADDSECPNNEKCCITPCSGRQCTAPVTAMDPSKLYIEPPGKPQMNQMASLPLPVCPCKKYKPEMCARIRFMLCANDSDCVNNEKCCNNGCGLQCMALVTG